jgi:hypothetical protein
MRLDASREVTENRPRRHGFWKTGPIWQGHTERERLNVPKNSDYPLRGQHDEPEETRVHYETRGRRMMPIRVDQHDTAGMSLFAVPPSPPSIKMSDPKKWKARK